MLETVTAANGTVTAAGKTTSGVQTEAVETVDQPPTTLSAASSQATAAAAGTMTDVLNAVTRLQIAEMGGFWFRPRTPGKLSSAMPPPCSTDDRVTAWFSYPRSHLFMPDNRCGFNFTDFDEEDQPFGPACVADFRFLQILLNPFWPSPEFQNGDVSIERGLA